MAYGGKPEWDDYFEDLNEKLPSIASAHKNTASEAKELVGEAQNELSEIRESDKVKKVPAVEESFQHLNDVVHGVHEYIDKVDDLYWKLQKQTPDVIQDLKQGKSEKLKKLIVDIEETIQNCKEKYDLFLDRCKEFTASCDTAERRCRRLQEEAENRKTMTQVGGGVATVGVAVAGTAISIIAGVLTGGIGAAVGLPLTAAAATATGATTAVAAHVFGKAAESFRKLSRRFSRLQSNISSVQNKIAEIDLSTNEYTHIRSMVRYRMNMTLTECREVAEEMKETERISKELYPVTTRGLKNVADAAENLRREFNRTF